MIRNLMIAALVASACGAVSTAWARGYSRRNIRQMPILERPSRPGHFYGNAVRRRNSRQVAPSVQGNPWRGYQQTPQTSGVMEQDEVQTQFTE